MIRTVHFEYYAFTVAPTYASFVIIMLITYVGIFKVASSHTDNSKKPIKVRTKLVQKNSLLMTILAQAIAIIVGCFVICWTPFMILLGIILYNTNIAQQSTVWRMYLFSRIPTLLNSMVNPLIYAWKLKDFRLAFLAIIKSACPLRRNSPDAPIRSMASCLSSDTQNV
jgi:7 transmembrane receptor (rhodopsin family)